MFDHLQLDRQFSEYHRIKTHRIRTRGQGVVRVLEETPGLVRSGTDAGVF